MIMITRIIRTTGVEAVRDTVDDE